MCISHRNTRTPLGRREKPSDHGAKPLEANRKSSIASKDIDAIILATTTPDAPCPRSLHLAGPLCLPGFPAFDINAACSAGLRSVMAREWIVSGWRRNVLTVGVDMQSRR